MALLHPTGAEAYAKKVTRLLPKAGRIKPRSPEFRPPSSATTFVWDLETDVYVASDLSGAPAQGVRFILYAINPVTGLPVQTLDELGYVDVIDVSTSTTLGTHVLVYAEGRTGSSTPSAARDRSRRAR